MRFYRDTLGRPISVAQAQKALAALRERTHARPRWCGNRRAGECAVEDAAMRRWYETRVETTTWPPADPQGQLPLADD